jgi:hypothetical protein
MWRSGEGENNGGKASNECAGGSAAAWRQPKTKGAHGIRKISAAAAKISAAKEYGKRWLTYGVVDGRGMAAAVSGISVAAIGGEE